MRTLERGCSLRRCPWWVVLVFACSFDSSGEGKEGETLGNASATHDSDGPSIPSTTTGAVSESTEGPSSGTGHVGSTGADVSTGGTAEDEDSGDEDTGEPAVLEDDGLVVRYYLDEPAAMPNTARDADPIAPFDLVHDWVPELSYVVVGDNRGLRWSEEGADGGPSAPVDGTKVRAQLEGEAAATIEVVAHIQSVRDKSRIVTVGKGNEDVDLGLLATDDTLYFRWRKNENAAFWHYEFSGSARRVLHVVLDAGEEGDDRVRLYVDGSLQRLRDGVDMVAGADITFENGCALILGNRPSGGHSVGGVLYYAALYATAFDEQRVIDHAAVLGENDDAP